MNTKGKAVTSRFREIAFSIVSTSATRATPRRALALVQLCAWTSDDLTTMRIACSRATGWRRRAQLRILRKARAKRYQ